MWNFFSGILEKRSSDLLQLSFYFYSFKATINQSKHSSNVGTVLIPHCKDKLSDRLKINLQLIRLHLWTGTAEVFDYYWNETPLPIMWTWKRLQVLFCILNSTMLSFTLHDASQTNAGNVQGCSVTAVVLSHEVVLFESEMAPQVRHQAVKWSSTVQNKQAVWCHSLMGTSVQTEEWSWEEVP